MLRTIKPRNARSKRALEAREAKEVEDARMAIFVRGTHTGEVVQHAMKELMALKKPHAISFSRKNAVRPFEDTSSLEFWAQKNDASMFLVGQSTKKRPNGLVVARTFDAKLLDMCELGVDTFVSMAAFKTPKSRSGHEPMMHFASELFDTHPRYVQLKSLLMDFFNAKVVESVCLPGLEHVISVTVGPSPPQSRQDDPNSLPKVHVRMYTVKLTPSGTRVPHAELTEMGPCLDLSLRRWKEADPEMWKAAMRRPKLKKEDVEKGLGKRKKNVEVDEMGDVRGRVHIARQDLGKLQTRKMKGLKPRLEGGAGDSDDEAHDDGELKAGIAKSKISMATSTPSSLVSPLTSSASSTSASSSTPATPATTSTTPPATTPTNASAAPSSSTSPTSTPSSSSSAATSTSSSSSATTSSTPTPTQIVTSSGGTVQTITTVITPTVTSTPTAQNNSSSSNSFFSNTAAVAGVFSVVGLIVVAIVVALVINTVRRRRAQKFDRDVAEAAAEAAASSRSPFDDYSYANAGGNGGGSGGYGYSDNSHGTYQLPPLHPQSESYGMSEMSQYDPYAAGAASLAAAAAVGRSRSRKDSEPGTPGIAGVGAGTLAREPSKRAPYHAFAGPGTQPQELQGSNGTLRSQRGMNQDILEAAGLAAAHASNNTNNGAFVTRKHSETTQNTHLSARSKYGSVSSGQHSTPLQSGYPVESYYPQRNDSHSADPFAGYPPISPVSKPLPNPYGESSALPPLPTHQSNSNEDHPELSLPTAPHADEQRMSYQDDSDYSHGNRVLRVANE
ncbi:hypothetical protein J3R82DRAFT_5138 [Butyriboletus roseoflavus]|nr:hypothetical protein J3R82DRAFT_5138 [Butyriboletus roseoflavus]